MIKTRVVTQTIVSDYLNVDLFLSIVNGRLKDTRVKSVVSASLNDLIHFLGI